MSVSTIFGSILSILVGLLLVLQPLLPVLRRWKLPENTAVMMRVLGIAAIALPIVLLLS